MLVLVLTLLAATLALTLTLCSRNRPTGTAAFRASFGERRATAASGGSLTECFSPSNERYKQGFFESGGGGGGGEPDRVDSGLEDSGSRVQVSLGEVMRTQTSPRRGFEVGGG